MTTLALIGSLGIILDFTIPPSLQKGSEILGGTLLVLLGGWILYDSLKGKFYLHRHPHATLEKITNILISIFEET